jgi:hypothetical protein
MIRLTIILGLLTTLSWGQKALDYKLYSKVIDAYIEEGIKYKVTTIEVLIIRKYVPNENQASFYGKEFLDSDEQIIDMTLHYDTTKIRLLKDEHVRNTIRLLEKEFYATPTLDENRFLLNTTTKTITGKKFQSYFKTIYGRRKVDKGWKKLYKKYPGAQGIFEFSQIIYEADYACFYVARHSNGLSGSGTW